MKAWAIGNEMSMRTFLLDIRCEEAARAVGILATSALTPEVTVIVEKGEKRCAYVVTRTLSYSVKSANEGDWPIRP